jgi:hypothetical protein
MHFNDLDHSLSQWDKKIQELEGVEAKALTLDAHEKMLYADLFLQAEGKTVAEREAWVYTRKTWKEFKLGHVEATTLSNKAKRELALKQKRFDAEYLKQKIEYELAHKQR